MQEFDMVTKAFNDSVFFHSFFMYFMPIPFLINLYTLFNQKDYVKINHKIWFVMPVIFFLISVGVFSGIFIMAMRGFLFYWNVVFMIVVTVVIFAGEILRIKKFKLAKTKEEFMIAYIRFCKVLYSIDFVLCLVVIFVR
ncbi:hypothetical protein [Helicobacter sp. 11S03491-1]|uniref:hypothetical protein n=1 Tax=Helicobacter sp. 11S03491-1 TaxID=1476196 RepID=UPI000BA78A84|nr:hypothetical protein [Helicobacter sp. 11S03491-1]PAF43060.1 hypothetical protein BKH45_03060 [Helicobacter sp. 11S03491-1]